MRSLLNWIAPKVEPCLDRVAIPASPKKQLQTGCLRKTRGIATLAMMFLATGAVAQQDTAPSDAQAAAQANNPLADITAFNIQNYYIGELTGLEGETANQFVLRFAQPIDIGTTSWLIRASLPVNTFPTGVPLSNETSVGDFDVFAAYQIDVGNPGVSFALGPQIVAPTAAKGFAGAEQWQLGLANVLFDARNPKFQWGYLAIYRNGVGDTNGRDVVQTGAFQPFGFYQLGDGWYTGGAPIWTYDFKSGNYSVPLGLRLGKVVKRGNTVFNVFAEPQYSIADRGTGLPKWQVYFALNMQFLGR